MEGQNQDADSRNVNDNHPAFSAVPQKGNANPMTPGTHRFGKLNLGNDSECTI
jgi:hypothetical protein